MNFCPVIVSSKAPLDKQIPPLVSLTRKDYYGVFNAKMLAKKVLRLDVTNSKAAIININFAGYRCLISPLL